MPAIQPPCSGPDVRPPITDHDVPEPEQPLERRFLKTNNEQPTTNNEKTKQPINQ